MVRGGSPEICGTVVMMANRTVVFVQEPHHMPSNNSLHWSPGDSARVFCHASCIAMMFVPNEVHLLPMPEE
jgi:hypothetical protein